MPTGHIINSFTPFQFQFFHDFYLIALVYEGSDDADVRKTGAATASQGVNGRIRRRELRLEKMKL